MDTENKFNLPRNTAEKVLFAIISILLSLIIIISSTLIIQNSYTQKITDEDIIFSYTIYGNEIIIKINPLTDIKNLEFTLVFNSDNNIYKETTTIKKCKGAESLERIIYVGEISKKLKNETPELISFFIKDGFKKNKATYQTYVYNDLSFSFDYQYAAIRYPNHKESIFTTKVTNTSNKSIVSIQHFIAPLHFENDIECEIFEHRYDFETPLKPGETRIIPIEYDVTVFRAEDEIKEKLFSSPKTAKSYTDIEYDIVYGNKIKQ